MTETTTKETATKTKRRIVEGVVISDKMSKTVILEASTLVKHPKYGKYYKKFKKYKVHDEKEECNPGDRVSAIECRPLSAQKRFRLFKILERAKGTAEVLSEEVA